MGQAAEATFTDILLKLDTLQMFIAEVCRHPES